jgi:hypothetical protein
MRYFIYLLIENLITRPQRVIKNLRSFFREKKRKKKNIVHIRALSLLSTLKITLRKENTIILRVTGRTTEQKQKQQLEERVAL